MILHRLRERVLHPGILALGIAAMAACSSGSSSDAGPDGACPLEVTLGTGDRTSFVPLTEGDPVEVWLGFQGLRMLVLASRLEGSEADTADLTMHLVVDATGVQLDQVDHQRRVVADGDGPRLVEDYLIFVNDAPASQLIGYTARLEHIARAGGCVGATRVDVELRDDHACVDTTVIVPDAEVPDGGLPDGSVACEDGS
jgi:hypothetical protein